MTSKLSVCLIARNEEANIARALNSVRTIAHEIIVVDTGSTDRTAEIAQSFGAHVVKHTWSDDFSAARNVALDAATGGWILMLDADEEVTPGMAGDLPEALSDQEADAYLSVMVNLAHGGQVKHRLEVCRLFRNGRGYRYSYRIHEQVIHCITNSGGQIKRAKFEILHFEYNPEEDRRKGRRERNLRMLQEALQADPDRTVLWYYLGVERLLLFQVHEAEACFRRHQEISPPEELFLSIAPLAEIMIRDYRTNE